MSIIINNLQNLLEQITQIQESLIIHFENNWTFAWGTFNF
ncbi:hypothetical protein NSP_51070 [Nodularia spumigena CCY9414]|nr:hypothetical protein NSP_51070 [Nodularia spumigena CCY9414]